MASHAQHAAPKVTALIDTYNQGRFIEEAIESVLAQDFPQEEMEIVVVDDGSTDDTPERVKRFGSRIRYFRKENGGQASALNFGFQQARGEIIAMLDGDDVWLPQKVRRVVEEFDKQPGAGLVYHPYQYWDTQQGLVWNDPQFPALTGNLPARRVDLLRYGSISTSGMALRRSVIAELSPLPVELVIYADSYLAGLVIFVAHVVAVPQHLTRYRLHADNLATFTQQDAVRLRRRWLCYRAAVREMRAWLNRRGYHTGRGDLADYLGRHDLVEQMLRFTVEPATRREWFTFLRDENRIYAPLWNYRYRFYRETLALAGLVLGYRLFHWLRAGYRRSTPFLRFRRNFIPAGDGFGSPVQNSIEALAKH